MYQLKYADQADLDLQTIYNYISQDSADRASNYLGKMEKCVLQLQDFPELGHRCRYTELDLLGIRILPFEDYLIFYIIDSGAETVNIIRVLHGSVNYKNLF